MTDHVRIADGVVYKRVGDETILLDFDAGVYYGLDSVGARIWELLADARSLEASLSTCTELPLGC